MKSTARILIGLLIMGFFIGGCNNANTPGETVKKWFKALEKEDAATLKEITVMPDGQPGLSEEQWEEMIIPEMGKELDNNDGIKSIEIVEEDYDNDKVAPGYAIVLYSITFNDGTKWEEESITLVEKDDNWKLTFPE
ncbi:MAG: DUF4878 domain-containing protein [Bacteroidales bacterium]